MANSIPALTRRQSLFAAAALLRNTLEAKGIHPFSPLTWAVPNNACDCHTHIIGDPARFPFAATRTYTPQPALPEDMRTLHKAMHVKRVVIVTPSVYGTDNSATLYGIQARGISARGVAVIDDKTSDRELDDLNAGGIKGIRLNFATGGQKDSSEARDRLKAAMARVKNRQWHIQIYTAAPLISAIKDLLFDSPVPIVFDHFAGIQTNLGPHQPGFADVLDLMRVGVAYVKLSGAYRASTQAPDYADVTAFAKGFIVANPDRVLWGTDWPHPNTTPSTKVSPPLVIDDGRLFNNFAVWCPDPQQRIKILEENPTRLYGF